MTRPAAHHDDGAARLRGGVLRFFVLVVVLSVPFWAIGDRPVSARVPLPAVTLMAVCPLLAAAVLVHRRDGWHGVRELLRRSVTHRRGTRLRWYVVALALAPAMYAAGYGAMRVAGRPLPDADVPWSTIPALFVLFFVLAVGEEAGWMGYAAEPLQQRWSALTASLVLGAIWAVWHYVPLVEMGRGASWIAWWMLSTLALRVLIVWLYNNTGGSILVTVLFHAMSNVAYVLFPERGSHYDPAFVAPIVALTAAAVTAVWGARTLAAPSAAGAAR